MIDDTVQVTLLTTNKSGTLSSLMMKCKPFGLEFTGNKIAKIDDKQSLLSMHFKGQININKEELGAYLLDHKQVIKVEKIVINKPELNQTPILEAEHDDEPTLDAKEAEELEPSFEISQRFFV